MDTAPAPRGQNEREWQLLTLLASPPGQDGGLVLTPRPRRWLCCVDPTARAPWGPHDRGGAFKHRVSSIILCVCLYLLDMEGFNSHGGLMEMEQLKLVADAQKGLADLVVLLPVIL